MSLLSDSDGILVTGIELCAEKPEKTCYPRDGFIQPVFYILGDKKIKTTIFSSKKKNLAFRFESTKNQIEKRNLRVTLNQAGRIESEISVLSIW